jgi:hypothetical protein
MSWLSSPKVRLGLIVNGLYFISLFTPASQHGRPRLFAHAPERHGDYAVQPDYPALPPPTSQSRASAFNSGGLLQVSLKKDLTLMERGGRKLILSPSFNALTRPSVEPNSVLFNFIIYSDKETCAGDCPLTINADGVTVWTSYAHGDSPGWQMRSSVPASSAKLEDGRVIKTMGAESLSTTIPYKDFVDIISATRVVVRLGPDWVELTADQIEALRDMHRHLQPPHPPDGPDSY